MTVEKYKKPEDQKSYVNPGKPDLSYREPLRLGEERDGLSPEFRKRLHESRKPLRL